MMSRHLPFAVLTVAFAAVGCSDAPARPAKLGLYMMIRNPSPTVIQPGQNCPTSTGVEWDIGKPIRMNGMVVDVDSPTPTDFGTTLEDGKGGADITCTVRKSGSFGAVGGGTDPLITMGGDVNFNLGGTAKKSGTPATNLVNLSVYTSKTFQLSLNPGFPSCSITAVHELAPGALWADYDCPALTEVSTPQVACHVSGTIVLEYCKTGEEEE
jgi:hypothetical protein